mgnify:CR=1 FL=1
MVGHKLLRRLTSWLVRHSTVKEIVETVLFIVALYFLVVGVLILAFNTSSYWMGVVSNSMNHEEWVDWKLYFQDQSMRQFLLSQSNLEYISEQDHLYDPDHFPIQGGFARGDLLVIRGVNSISEISVGDVIIIERPNDIPLTHRVFAAWEENGKIRFTTKGDYNSYLLSDDMIVYPEQIIGKVVYVIPKLGNISVWFQGR